MGMGNPTSSILTEIFLQHCEDTHRQTLMTKHNIKHYSKYEDVTQQCRNRKHKQLIEGRKQLIYNLLLKYYKVLYRSRMHKSINYTMKTEQNNYHS